MPDYPIAPPTLDTDFCHRNWQETANILFGGARVSIPASSADMVKSPTEPGVSERGKVWFRVAVDGDPDRMYVYYNGRWVAKHFLEPGIITLWLGTAAAVPLLDGGVAGTATIDTGPFWEVAAEFAARMPLGVGTLPVSSTVVAEKNTGGVEKVQLALPEVPSHRHRLKCKIGAKAGDSLRFPDPNNLYTANSEDETIYTEYAGGGDASGGVAHQNMPPYIGAYFIRRTIRRYHTP